MYHVWPLAFVNGEFTAPDSVLAMVWEMMDEQGKVEDVFYGGSVKTAEEFIAFLKNPENLPVLVHNDRPEVRLLAWMNGLNGGQPFGHFCFLGRFSVRAARKVLEYWDSMKLWSVIMGLTPETNTQALRALEMVGFQLLRPAIPGVCNMVYEGRTVGGIVSYYEL